MSNVSSSNSHKGLIPKLRFSGYSEPYTSLSLRQIATKVNRVDAKSTAPIMMISAASGFINQSEKYSHDNAGKSLKKYTLLRKGELSYNHGASKLREFGCCFELKVAEARIPYVYHSFSISKQFAPYIAILLNNPIIDKKLKRLVSSSVRIDGLLNISFDEYMSIEINIPSYNEQKKIYEFFTKLEQRIQKQQELIECLKSYKRGLSITIFDKKSLIINSTVKTVSLSSFCNITMGQSPDSTSYNTEGIGLPLVQGNADMKNGITAPTKYTLNPTKTCDAGNIILSVRAPVGSVGISNQQICIGRGVCSISSANNDYILQYLKHCEKQWRTLEQGGTFTAISGDDIKTFPLILPNDKEIARIVKLLKEFDNLISCQETLLVKLIHCKQSMLQRLFI